MVIRMKLDKEEQEILDAYDNGEYIQMNSPKRPTPLKLSTPSKVEKEKIKSMADQTFRKNRRVTIRLYDHDLKGLQKKAMEKVCDTKLLFLQ